MKVILLQDIVGFGRKYEVKDVSDGYARNFLLPRQLAKIATNAAVKELDQQRAKQEKEHQERLRILTEAASKISGLTLEFKMKGGDKGEIFGSVSKADIKKSLEDKRFKNVEVELPHPLRQVGEHQVEINLGEGIKTKVRILIETDRN